MKTDIQQLVLWDLMLTAADEQLDLEKCIEGFYPEKANMIWSETI